MAEKTKMALNPDSIFERYKAERAKRMSSARQSAITLPTDSTLKTLDSWATPIHREPLNDEIGVAIIGGGFGGLMIAANLRKSGVKSIRIFEAASDFGGTWYWNRYPGAQCDIQSYIYLPFLEDVRYIPKERYSRQPEIWAHSQAIGRHFDLYKDACFQTRVTSVYWDAEASRWHILTDRGDDVRARFVCLATGAQSRPKLPAIAGINSFAGHSFHTSRWDYDYTGGGAEGALVKLRDKTVGVIGTGATAIQCIPPLAKDSAKLYVFQRTPSTVWLRGNRPTDPDWATGLKSGWQQEWIENFTDTMTGVCSKPDLVADGWTQAARAMALGAETKALSPTELAKASQLADLVWSEKVRARVDEIVKDPRVAESLKAYYAYFCKRPCFHDEYLQSFNRPNVELIDTRGSDIDRIVPEGVIFEGKLYKLDCLIFATGFEIGAGDGHPMQYDIVAPGGVTIKDKFAGGTSTFFGMMSRGFPNMTFMPGIVTPGIVSHVARTPNFLHLEAEIATQSAYIIENCLRNNVRAFDVAEAAESNWVQMIVARYQGLPAFSRLGVEYLLSCVPGYLNNEGRPVELDPRNASYVGSPREFFGLLKAWREAGELEGLELVR